jgi:hypothetical protein
VLRSFLRDVRQARAAAIGDAAHLALLAQSPHDDDDEDGDDDDGTGPRGGRRASLALTASVVSPLNAGVAGPAEERAGGPAYIRRQRLQQDGGVVSSLVAGEQASPRPDVMGSHAASAPPASPQSPVQAQQQPQRWSVGKGCKNGGESHLQRGKDGDMI